MRDQQRRETRRRYWWRHGETVPTLRTAIALLSRYIATPRVAKHRLFVWLDRTVLPDSRLYAIARDDDITFGILHSHIHELWSLRTCSWHGVGNDPTYNAQSCFETFRSLTVYNRTVQSMWERASARDIRGLKPAPTMMMLPLPPKGSTHCVKTG